MSSWAGRLLSANLPESSIPADPSATQPSQRDGDDSFRGTEAESSQHEYIIPTLRSPRSTRTTSADATDETPRRPGHRRSISHPLPSLLSGQKKRQGDNAAIGHDLIVDEPSPSPQAPRSASKAGKGKITRVLDKDLTTGKCMTCDSMVRWPKELKVFRCTVCMTINDLKPIRNDLKRGIGRRAYEFVSGGLSPEPAVQSEVVSLQRTIDIIEQCLISYLLDRMRHGRRTDCAQSEIDHHIKSAPHRVVPISHRSVTPQRTKEDIESDPEFLSRHYSSSPAGFSDFPSTRDGGLRSANESENPNPPTRAPPPPPGLMNLGSSELPLIGRLPGEGGCPAKSIFKPLQDYIAISFASYETVNSSFMTDPTLGLASRTSTEGASQRLPRSEAPENIDFGSNLYSLDAKTLLLGNVAENGSWWAGESEPSRKLERSPTNRNKSPRGGSHFERGVVNARSPNINWSEVHDWYQQVMFAGSNWKRHLNGLIRDAQQFTGWRPSGQDVKDIEEHIREAEVHTQRVLLKATETLLKRPGGYLRNPDEIRFLMVILANPLLYSPAAGVSFSRGESEPNSRDVSLNLQAADSSRQLRPQGPVSPSPQHGGGPGHHSGIIKRVLGLLSNLPNECHHLLVGWFARFPETQFKKITDLVGSFVTHRLMKQNGRTQDANVDPMGGLIPTMSVSGRRGSAALRAAIGTPGQTPKHADGKSKPVVYNDDWQIKAAARVMALLFSANNAGILRKSSWNPSSEDRFRSAGLVARERARRQGQILSTSDFYNSLLDYSDLIADFEAWEAKRGKFTFCQYPFFLSIWAKIQIMEHDARRQMEIKAREAFFDSIMTRKAVNQYLVLRVRRECLVEDSLKGVSEVVGTGGEEIKKGLRIEFKGEEGIDAGGLRKEWFLLLVRDIFNPEHGMFIYDEDSQACYFNPNSFETSDQYFLVGVLLGLAIYNSTILDIALPPFAFRKLLAAAPVVTSGAPSHTKHTMVYTLEDLHELRPALANGLRQLLEYDGDVEGTFCRDFVADVERYGQVVQIPLCPGGEKRPVNNANRQEFVDLYVRYLLDTAVARQFEPFKRGFFTVCGGNALSLFRPEEIELLIRGSDEPLDILSLEAVSACENWGFANPADTEPVIGWFWKTFRAAERRDQRKLLSFITGSDRIPAMGAANLVIKLSCLGDDSSRFPVARTCFNQLSLYRYGSCQKLETMLWRAVNESEGFGLK